MLRAGNTRVQLTHLDRVYWPASDGHPAYTKRALLEYLLAMAEPMLAFLRDRPLTLLRYPTGLGGKHFFQKHVEFEPPDFVAREELISEHNHPGQYLAAIWLQGISVVLLAAVLVYLHKATKYRRPAAQDTNDNGSGSILAGQIGDNGFTGHLERNFCHYTLTMSAEAASAAAPVRSATPDRPL